MAIFQGIDYGDDRAALLNAAKAFAQNDQSLVAKGFTRGGQTVNLGSVLGDDQLLGYYNDPTKKDEILSSALGTALQGGVDIGSYGAADKKRYLTTGFSGIDDYTQNAAPLYGQALSYLSDPSKYTVLGGDTKLSALPEFSGLQQAGDLSRFGLNVYDKSALDSVLSGYSLYDPSKLGDDIFSSTIKQRGIDLGGQAAIKKSEMDYYRELATAADAAGLGYYGVNAISPQLSELYNFEASKYGIPVARFGGVEGAQDQRFIPYELLTELHNNPTYGGLGSIAEFIGNEDIFKNGQLALLPEEYASQLAGSDWFGTDLSTLNNPRLGYLLSAAGLGDVYSGGQYTGAPDGAVTIDSPVLQSVNGSSPHRPFSNETPSLTGRLPWMENQGSVTGLADVPIRRVTPEIQSAIDQKIKDYQLAQQTFLGNGMYAGLSEDYLAPYRGAEWVAVDPNNSANILLGQTDDTGATIWRQLGPSLTEAGRSHLGGTLTAIQQNNAAEAKGDTFTNLFSTAISGLISAGAAGVLGPLLGPVGAGALSSGVMSAINGGDVLQGAVSGGITGAMSGGGDAFAAVDAAQLAGQGLEVSQIAEILSQNYGMAMPSAYMTALAGAGSTATGLSAGALQSGIGGATSAAVRGGSLEEIFGSGIGGGIGGALAEADLGGKGSLLDKYGPGVAGSLTKDLLLTGGENVDRILTGAIAGAAGGEVGGVLRNALRPSDETLENWTGEAENNWLRDATDWATNAVASLVANGVSREFAEQFVSDEVNTQRGLVQSMAGEKTAAARDAAAAVAQQRNNMRNRFAQWERRRTGMNEGSPLLEEEQSDMALLAELMADPEFAAMTPDQQAEYMAQLKEARRKA